MIRAGRRVFPVLLLAALAALFAVLLVMPWSAHAQAVPTLQIEDASASEGAGALEFTVSLADGATPTQAVTVDYATTDGDALAGNDYTGTSGTLTIPTGASSGVISVPIIDDDVVEDDETFTLTLSNPSNAALPGGASSVAATGTIIDDDKPTVTITLRQDEVFVGQPAVFDFTRAGSATDRLLIPFRVSIADLDNVVIPGARYDNWSPSFITPNVVIPANETSVEWSWHPEDGIGEDYLVHLSPITAPDLFDVDIEEDYFTLTVRHRPVFVSSSPPDGLPAITIAAVSGGEDGVPTVAEGEDATFTLTRTGDTMEALTVHVRTEEPYHPGWNPRDSFNPTVKIHPVTFTTGTATATLDVAIDDDDVPESADWLEAQVSPPAGGNYSKGDPHRAWVNIIDERVDHDSLSGLVEVGIVAATSSVREGEPVRVDTVRPEFPDDGRDYPPLNVKVHISQDGAGIPEDRLGIIASVHPWYAFRGVNRLGFPTLTNDGREPPTTVTFTILESPEYRIDPARASVTVTVRDRDPLPVLEIADSTAHRGAESIEFQVSYADGLPSYQTVTVDYATSDGTATAGQEYAAATGTLTIPPGETGGVITVQLNPADNQDADLDFSLTLTTPAYATFAEAAAYASATGTINHRPGVSIRARQSEVLEGETALFELRRSGTPSSELTVKVFTREPNHPEDSSNGRLHTVIFPTGSSTATLQVIADHDGVEEDEGDFLEALIAQSVEDEYRTKDPDRVTVRIRDLLADITIAADQETINEGDIDEEVGSVDATFTLSRAGTTANALTVTVRVDDPEMIRCFDHVYWHRNCPEGPTFDEEVTFAENSATATLAVPIFDDWRDVPDGSALTVTVIDGEGYRPGNPDSASVTLVDDDDTSVLILSTSHDEITEGNTLTCTVTRYGDISYYREQFPLEISGTGRGRSADEYIYVELAAGVDRYTYTFDLEDDGEFGGDWTQTCRIDWIDLYVPLEQERQYFVVIGPRSITVPVRDAGGSHVTIAPDQPSITEGESATFTLTRTGDISDELTVRVSVEDPAHFMRGNHDWGSPQVPSREEFEAGSATATLSLKTRNDWRDIPDGVLTATIRPGDYREYRPGATSSASVTVLDNDTKPEFQLSANDETITEGENVVFELTRTGNFTHPQTVRLLIGRRGAQKVRTYEFSGDDDTRQTVISTRDNDLDEPDTVFEAEFHEPVNEYYAVSKQHASATVTVEDDDLPRVSVEALAGSYREGERPVFRITREGRTDSALPVRLKITESGQKTVYNPEYQLGTPTPLMRVSYATYDHHLFLDEGDGDEDDGAVEVELLESDDYVIDPEKSSASFTVIDTDPEPVLRVSRANDSHIVSEDAGAVEFTVSYEGPASQKGVTVDYHTLSGTATAGVDYTATSGTLAFADGETGGVISVPVIQDSRPEHDETFFLVLTNPRNAGLEDGEHSIASLVTIEDDESRVSIYAAADEVTEGEPAVFNLTRTGDLTDELFVSLLVMEERTGSESNPLFPMTATFPAGTSTVQVTHPTVDDDVDAQPFLVIALVRDLAALARTSTYVPLKYVASVTVQDDELPTVTIEAAEDRREENEDADSP